MDKEDMTGYVYPQRTVERPDHRVPPAKWYSPLEPRPWVLRALQYRPKKRQNSRHSHTASSEKWYSPLELRPWVVRAMGYRPQTREISGHPHLSPFRRYIEEIVVAKIAEHLGTETATRLSRATEDTASEVSAAEDTTEDGGTAANLVHGLEEAFATLGHAEEGTAHQHHPTSAGIAQAALTAAEHILTARNHPLLQFPIPRNPRSKTSRREYRKRLISLVIDFLMPNLAKPGPARRPASPSPSPSASTFASESIAEERPGHGARPKSATRPYKKSIWPWRSKRKNRDRGHKKLQKRGHRNEDHLVEGGESKSEDAASNETSKSELSSSTTSISARVGVNEREPDDDDDDDDHHHHHNRLAQDGTQPAPRPEIHNNMLRGGGGGAGNNQRNTAELSTGKEKGKNRARSRSRSRGRSWSRNGANWNFHG